MQVLSLRQVLWVVVTLQVAGTIVMALPFPQNFEEAVRQAQEMSLIPNGAQIDRTSPAIQVAYFKLGEHDRFNQDDLRQVLAGIPQEVVSSLESQVMNIGRGGESNN